ncbi:cytochrome c oxidase assembly factor Coa1 family protein [uncultured Aquimarina sp.]|uniref:cytochrome c oxidase assembly factor Coa1 family protein n=1 Tax=uncultured Aquimarina sp. TaxID=575652 RepID=UPI0026387F51|nr:cytochrome c oxidase assembly factor Coa1 family protein [uncultured Aquimarina sp.]
MNNEIIEHKSWWKRNWKWFIPLIGLFLVFIILFSSSNLGNHMGGFAKAYADSELSKNALEIAKQNKRVIEVMGDLKPIDNFAILAGEVMYSNDSKSVDLYIPVEGSKSKEASMDISADRINGKWNYKKINIRIKEPVEEKEIIEVIKQLE